MRTGNNSRRGLLARLGSGFVGTLEYIPIVLTIVLATYVSVISNNSKTKPAELLQWIVALLGLIATSLLIERFVRLRRIDTAIRGVNDIFAAFMAERIRATDFFVDEIPPLQGDIDSASNIFVVAVNGQAFLVEYKNSLAERIREGTDLRVLAVDPTTDSARRIANPEKSLPVSYLEATAQITKQTLVWIDGQRQGRGSVELRYVDYVPMFSAYAFDRHSPRGKMAVGLYRQFWNHERRPHAVLTKLHDGYWYEYYKAQLEEAWERGRPVRLDNPTTPSSP